MRVVVTDKGLVTEASDGASFEIRVPTTLATSEIDASALPTVTIRSTQGRNSTSDSSPFTVDIIDLVGSEVVAVDAVVVAKSSDASVRKRWSHSAFAYRSASVCGFDEDVTTATKGNSDSVSSTFVFNGSTLQMACTGSATPLAWSWEIRVHKQKDA